MTEERSITQYQAPLPPEIAEKVIAKGDLSALTPTQRVQYYMSVCEAIGVSWKTKPFEYLDLDGKLVLYATRSCTDQLRDNRGISLRILSREKTGELYIVTAQATATDGRTDESTGIVSVVKEAGEWKTAQSGKRFFAGTGEWGPVRGDALANVMMKAETKAKRRATLSICGLGWMDETELETVPRARPVQVDHDTGEIIEPGKRANGQAAADDADPLPGLLAAIKASKAHFPVKIGTGELTKADAISHVLTSLQAHGFNAASFAALARALSEGKASEVASLSDGAIALLYNARKQSEPWVTVATLQGERELPLSAEQGRG